MEKLNAVEVLFISLNQKMPFVGKLWLAVFLLLRVFVLLFAGFPLFWDEGDHFVCNTIHPSCTSVCFDAYTPLSLCRFGFLHVVCVCVPTVLYVTHHTHHVLTALTHRYVTREHTLPLNLQIRDSKVSTGGGLGGRITGPYLLQLILRVFLELAFGVGQYFLFGLSVRRDFLCVQEPCSPAVECFAPRATEKTFLLRWMLGNVVLSVLLSAAEMLLVLRGSIRDRRRQTEEERKRSERERSDFSSSNETAPLTPSSVPLPFWKRKPAEDPTLTPSLTLKSSLSPWSEAGGRTHTSSCSPSHTHTPEEASEQVGCEVVLCSAERMRLWKGRCGINGSAKAPLPAQLTSNRVKAEPWSSTPTRTWRSGHYTPATTTTEPASDSSESQDRKAWV